MVTSTLSRRWVVRLDPDLASCFRGTLYPHPLSHEMRAAYSLRQVHLSRKLIFTLFYLMLLTTSGAAFPSQKMLDSPKSIVIQHKDSITVRTTGCKPLTHDDLKTLMGIAWDDTKMRNDDVINDDDDVIGGGTKKRGSSGNSVIDKNEQFLQNYFKDESDIDDIGVKSDKDTSLSVQNRKFMRRRKRDEEDSENTNTPTDTRFLYQNMVFDTISRRKSRQKRSRSSDKQFHPAWECEIKQYWKPMSDEYFPKYIWEGECTQKSCFFGLYRCKPVKYTIKLLKRDPENACRPVPLIGETTTYEEAWVIQDHEATVACECGLKSGRSSGKRNKNKNKKGKNRNRGRDE
ncbi:uncharacterized protein LOC128213153 [Mya arenaria]|uniref:uncharacterized protein LOC128213153 n=1 Tax=Mya arenaria TaxID=6604 RepID=UPI0022E31B89|nr:uncharacterized protein LOC128213153 [Mya arenaria]XP_052774662.1 uncharacterized protein LOC128213153 [Mya arenaria]XP_052774664.1 uncharacterized protein LOC128213153 [Mya arenaria]